ncbi:kinase-like protein [Mytilinidion resinicola]|uniref:non-specific serine/threonine protein kinase n=1 Tax=Mytilinidion resinicola TaxID=574789 RepID=A0A6A6XZ00_9PEZI|nr:kinase-like protein [Mytilinidion resinicola]KAF2801483.1 kinase-like protein [Mytilinidion resinicola]
MAPTSDLVRDSRLRTRFYAGHTHHTYYVSGITARQRTVKREERWQRCGSLGSGAFGTVWLEKLVSDEAEAKQRAVKEIRKNSHRSNTIDYSRELEAIAKFSHENYERCFVRSFGWYESGESVFIAMEYFPFGDLDGYISSPLPELEVQQITFQILEGVAFMHENGFAHRDLKPTNILIKSRGPDWWVKIGDFGISKRAEEGLTALRTLNGTPGFLAPEMLVQLGLLDMDNLAVSDRYTVAVDIWSLGEITFRALTGESPFPIRRLGPYAKGKTTFPVEVLQSHNVSTDGCDFVKSLMAPLPRDRLTAKDAVAHDWLESQRPSSARSSLEIQR